MGFGLASDGQALLATRWDARNAHLVPLTASLLRAMPL
jgi:hypothetical protein